MKKSCRRQDEEQVKRNQIFLSENNRITYVYKQIVTGKIIEITNVSYDVYFKNNWITIVRYDNYHGYMHKHVLISLDNTGEIVDKIGVRQKGTNKRLLRWAIDDVKKTYFTYKRKIIYRTKKRLKKKINIDFY